MSDFIFLTLIAIYFYLWAISINDDDDGYDCGIKLKDLDKYNEFK